MEQQEILKKIFHLLTQKIKTIRKRVVLISRRLAPSTGQSHNQKAAGIPAGMPAALISIWEYLLFQIHHQGIFLQIGKELVRPLLLFRDLYITMHIFTIACAGWYKTSHNDVFLQAAQIVHLALKRCLCEYLCGLLEGCRGNKGRRCE